MGICAVILNVLIDKGVITQDELLERFGQAYEAAQESTGGSVAAEALAAMVSYLEPKYRVMSLPMRASHSESPHPKR
jgi:hypothetical protein